jgi:tRNA modification GTPase
MERDTIVAQATPAGQGGVSIVRISGQESKEIAAALACCNEEKLKPKIAQFQSYFDRNKQAIDEGISIYFKAPYSFTGEDVIEIQCHGSPVVVDTIIKEACFLGARPAQPGEFSERAFLNGKIDLVQAEAIADLISSQSESAARNALASLQGKFSEAINAFNHELLESRIYIEAAIDFPDEEGVDFIGEGKVEEKIRSLREKLKTVFENAQQGNIFQEGINVVLAGEPNAGKSSLLNLLSRKESAIVTDIAGTTRDVLSERINLKGIPLRIIDTAGLRESNDPVEQEGIRRAWKEISQADFILYLYDSRIDSPFSEQEAWKKLSEKENLSKLQKKIFVLANKSDLSKCPVEKKKINVSSLEFIQLSLSAKKGEGLDMLEQAIFEVLGIEQNNEGMFSARRRHLEALEEAKALLDSAISHLEKNQGGEFIARRVHCRRPSFGS